MSRPDTQPRLIDRIVAAIALVIGSPVSVLAAIAIKLSSRGPVIYRAERAGIHGEPFTMFKFRTMHSNAGADARITSGADPRVFGVGRLLRRSKVDELPQLLNVVLGQMAIVGPRPEDPTIVRDHYTAVMRESLAVLPGLTSPGSLSYFADEAALPDDPAEAERRYVSSLLPRKIAMDLVYVRNRTRGYDLELVIRTLGALVGATSWFGRRQASERDEAEAVLTTILAERAPSGGDVR